MKNILFLVFFILFVSCQTRKQKEIKSLEEYIKNAEMSYAMEKAKFDYLMINLNYGKDTIGIAETAKSLDIGRKNIQDAKIELMKLK